MPTSLSIWTHEHVVPHISDATPTPRNIYPRRPSPASDLPWPLARRLAIPIRAATGFSPPAYKFGPAKPSSPPPLVSPAARPLPASPPNLRSAFARFPAATRMVGSVGNGLADLGASMNGNGKAAAEPLPMEMDPPADVMAAAAAAEGEAASNGRREIVMGRNVHTSCFAVKEPDADDEETGEREATMASVLALYRRSLVERTKHHLGTSRRPPRPGSVDSSLSSSCAPPRSGSALA